MTRTPSPAPISEWDDLEDGETYCYNQDTSDDTTYRIELWDDINEGECITLHYRDGYVSDLTRTSFVEHIADGKVYEVV